jgi:hypothetical protein
MTTLAYSLLKWIRSNKEELARLASLHPELPISSLQYFEQRYRGASHWLKNPMAADIPADFPGNLRQHLGLLLETIRPHRKQFAEAGCATLFDMPGLSETDYHEYYRRFLSVNLTRAAGARKNLEISHNGRYGQLTLTMSNGIATTVHQWDYATALPDYPRGDLRQQMEGLEKGWKAIRDAFSKFIYDESNWPSDTKRNSEEQARVARLSERLLDSLSVDDFTLLRKHQAVFRQHLNTRLA